MNQGGEPEHDDYGLPRVDIQVPDDARELYADVLAYHRELRALRRHQRSLRWRAPLRRSNSIVPIIAGCLVIAMIASMVLTMFTANPYFGGINGPRRATPTAGKTPAAGKTKAGKATSPAPAKTPVTTPGQTNPGRTNGHTAKGQTTPGQPLAGQPLAGQAIGAPLPGSTISVAGKPVTLSTLTSTALAIVPASCGCAEVIGELLAQAQAAGITVYLVGPRGSLARLSRLAPSSVGSTAKVAIDQGNVLATMYRPQGLTLLLVDSRGSVIVQPRLRAGAALEAQLRSLKPAHTAR